MFDRTRWLNQARATVVARLGGAATQRWAGSDQPHGGCLLNLDGERVVGQFTVWPDGSYEAEVWHIETGARLLAAQASGADEAQVTAALLEALGVFAASEGGSVANTLAPAGVGPTDGGSEAWLMPSTRQAFLHRFGTFFDAVLDWLHLDLEADTPFAELLFQAQDASAPSGWSDVWLRIDDLSGFRLTRPDLLSVQSFGVQVLWRDDRVHLFFNSLHDAPDDWPPARDIVGQLTGARCRWQAKPHGTNAWPAPVARDASGAAQWPAEGAGQGATLDDLAGSRLLGLTFEARLFTRFTPDPGQAVSAVWAEANAAGHLTGARLRLEVHGLLDLRLHRPRIDGAPRLAHLSVGEAVGEALGAKVALRGRWVPDAGPTDDVAGDRADELELSGRRFTVVRAPPASS